MQTEEPISNVTAIKDFNVQDFVACSISMFDGEEVTAALIVDKTLIAPLIDRFGKGIEFYALDEQTARVHVKVFKSDTLYGWLAQFGKKIEIESPKVLAAAYKTYLQEIVEMYDGEI